MGLIEFKDLPDTSTPLNAENLNNNFNALKGEVLFEGTSETTGEITLNETTANYDYLEIYFSCWSSGIGSNSTKVFEPNGKNVGLNTFFIDGENAYNQSCNILISGDEIEILGGCQYNFSSSSNQYYGDNQIRINKVIGYATEN